ncbi:hypothetical protein K8R33_04030 [archaeon]|nr:hypothetical protein [archaeon]
MLFTNKLFKQEIDQEVHDNLIRFSLGTFEDRALMKITIAKGKLKVDASYDLLKDITKIIAENIDKISIKGKVIQSKKKDEFDKEISGEELKELCEKNTFVLLNLTFGEYSVEVGKTIPKPGSALKKNFCKCILPITLLNNFTDLKDFKKLEISHTFVIEEVIVPEEYKNDFAQARIHAKRKGKLIRKIVLDKKESQKEIEFEA